MSKDIARVWEFASSSNPNHKYETLQYTDNSTSCNCPNSHCNGGREDREPALRKQGDGSKI